MTERSALHDFTGVPGQAGGKPFHDRQRGVERRIAAASGNDELRILRKRLLQRVSNRFLGIRIPDLDNPIPIGVGDPGNVE